jgi:uncharacterized damage-inducible protein DinB
MMPVRVPPSRFMPKPRYWSSPFRRPRYLHLKRGLAVERKSMAGLELPRLLENLRNGPYLLQELVEKIPAEKRRWHAHPEKWCIHAHACHLVQVQALFLDRMDRFLKEENPVFVPYFPEEDRGEDGLHAMALGPSLQTFHDSRQQLLEKAQDVPASFWTKPASHPEYRLYSPHIMLRHVMMHDYFHMYRIEDLWITQDGYFGKSPGRLKSPLIRHEHLSRLGLDPVREE